MSDEQPWWGRYAQEAIDAADVDGDSLNSAQWVRLYEEFTRVLRERCIPRESRNSVPAFVLAASVERLAVAIEAETERAENLRKYGTVGVKDE